MAKKKHRGGRRTGAGRPTKPDDKKAVKVMISLARNLDEYAKRLGGGKRSVGIANLLKAKLEEETENNLKKVLTSS